MDGVGHDGVDVVDEFQDCGGNGSIGGVQGGINVARQYTLAKIKLAVLGSGDLTSESTESTAQCAVILNLERHVDVDVVDIGVDHGGVDAVDELKDLSGGGSGGNVGGGIGGVQGGINVARQYTLAKIKLATVLGSGDLTSESTDQSFKPRKEM
ncbi:hypothetical protein HDU76_013781 [Blyttiomyces sp. JEL0837]|nr:hypothetical protein HDU76_013781 [Blyttiomyces sp. JEL0837]